MAGCECIFQQLTTKHGVNTVDKLKALNAKALAAARSTNVAAAAPPQLRAAALACKSSLL